MKEILNQSGTAAVETAIIFMLLLMFLFGIIEFGLLLFDKQLLTNAGREGARAGIVVGLGRTDGQYLTESSNVAAQYCENYLVGFGSDDLVVTSALTNDADGSGGPSRGDNLTVSLTYEYGFLFLSALGIGPVTLDSVATMKLE